MPQTATVHHLVRRTVAGCGFLVYLVTTQPTRALRGHDLVWPRPLKVFVLSVSSTANLRARSRGMFKHSRTATASKKSGS